MSVLCLMMLLASPYEGVLPDGIELTCTFDTPTVRLGDLAYCKVQVRNQGEVSRKVSILTPWTGLWFKIQPLDESLAVIDHHGWSSGGGGGFGGGGTIVLLPEESLVGWMRVSLFTAESLREMRDQPVTHLRLLAMYHQVVSHYPVATLRIRGSISKHPREIDLVSKLYVPYKEHPETPAWWEQMDNTTPTFDNSEGMSQVPWMYNTPQGLQELRGQLDEESAMYRAVRILQAQQAVTFARPEDKKKAMDGLLKELERCGPAEREWFRRGAVQSTFRHARDFESAKLFGEPNPESLWPYERYTLEGRLEPVTQEEGLYGRRPDVSTPEAKKGDKSN